MQDRTLTAPPILKGPYCLSPAACSGRLLTSDKGHGGVTTPLKPAEDNYPQEVPKVQGVGCRIESTVYRDLGLRHELFKAVSSHILPAHIVGSG